MSRARLLLRKQDRVSVLEEKLQVLDREEQRLLFLGSLRRDVNTERESLLSELDRALADYGSRNSLQASDGSELTVSRCTC